MREECGLCSGCDGRATYANNGFIKKEIFDVLLAVLVLLLGIQPKSIELFMSQTPLIVCGVNRKGALHTQKSKTPRVQRYPLYSGQNS